MKKILSISVVFLALMMNVQQLNAQSGDYEKVKAAMVSYYTEHMDLTPEQAAKFWPIHNEYETERRKINKEIRRLKKSGNPNDLSVLEKLEKQRFELRTKFKSRFLEVITPAQLSKMYKAEEEFFRIIMDKMKD